MRDCAWVGFCVPGDIRSAPKSDFGAERMSPGTQNPTHAQSRMNGAPKGWERERGLRTADYMGCLGWKRAMVAPVGSARMVIQPMPGISIGPLWMVAPSDLALSVAALIDRKSTRL